MDMEGTSLPVNEYQRDVHDYVSKSHHSNLQLAMNNMNSILLAWIKGDTILPKFSDGIDPGDYISWALNVDKIFRVHNYDKPKKIAMVSLKFDK